MSEEVKRELGNPGGNQKTPQPEQPHQSELATSYSVLKSQSSEGDKEETKNSDRRNFLWQKLTTTEKFNFWLMIFTGVYAFTTSSGALLGKLIV